MVSRHSYKYVRSLCNFVGAKFATINESFVVGIEYLLHWSTVHDTVGCLSCLLSIIRSSWICIRNVKRRKLKSIRELNIINNWSSTSWVKRRFSLKDDSKLRESIEVACQRFSDNPTMCWRLLFRGWDHCEQYLWVSFYVFLYELCSNTKGQFDSELM